MTKKELLLTNARLEYLGEGLHKCGWFTGWIGIGKSRKTEEEEEYLKVLWCSEKYAHDLHKHSAVMIEYYIDGVRAILKTALSLHIIEDEKEKNYCLEFLNDKILKAYQKKSNTLTKKYKSLKYKLKKTFLA